jgi:N-dimethylarginine dimethylaminohydrolase
MSVRLKMDATVYDRIDQLPGNFLASLPKMPLPTRLLMCPPESFDVVDVKNPHMQGNIGMVDKNKAKAQWRSVNEAFTDSCGSVELIQPVADCEDMVFCANQTFVGLDAQGDKLCVLSRMKHASRQREVGAFAQWFRSHGYRVEEIPANLGFEGSGDAIWHPGKALVWGGSGFRSDGEVYPHISRLFGVPVLRLPLKSDRFYHLDTCFCAIDEHTALIHAPSLTKEGVEMIKAVFTNVIECDDTEANEGMACNATAIGGKHVIIQSGNTRTCELLKEVGYQVHEVDTSEYLKSGGSVFCMKMYVF